MTYLVMILVYSIHQPIKVKAVAVSPSGNHLLAIRCCDKFTFVFAVADAERVDWSFAFVCFRHVGRWRRLLCGVSRHEISTGQTVLWGFGLVHSWTGHCIISWSRSLLQIFMETANLAASTERVRWCASFTAANGSSQHWINAVNVGTRNVVCAERLVS